MTRSRRLTLSTAALALLAVATSGFTARRPSGDGRIVTVGMVAGQLGVKVGFGEFQEFALGAQFTGTLDQPEKLAAFGLTGMHKGARVYAARIAADKVQVEADELDPPKRASAKLSMGPDGKLTAPPRV